MDGHRGDVLQLCGGTRRHLDAELGQHIVEGLHGEGRLGGLVAGPGQTHHQAVADQLVGPHALDAGDVLQPIRLGQGHDQGQGGSGDEGLEHGAHPQKGISGLPKNWLSQPG